jgi:hypothetical protein
MAAIVISGKRMAERQSAWPLDRARLSRVADALVVAIAVSLPLSTSAASILLVLWLIAVIPTLDWPDVRRELLTWPGGLPVLLFLLGVIGMAWADVSLAERWQGLDSFFKLLVVPLLFAQFRRADCAQWVFGGFVAACVFLMIVAAVGPFVPPVQAILKQHDHVLVKNPATQSGEFVICIFGLLLLAVDFFERKRWLALARLFAIVFGMLAEVLYLATGRTALVVAAVLLALFVLTRLTARAGIVVAGAAILIATVAWYSSPYLHKRTAAIWTDLKQYQSSNALNSAGERVEFAKKSLAFLGEAPVLGHGTGSIHAMFEKSSDGKTGAAALATTNPHNQTFAVAIQLGSIGVFVLWAMWLAHLCLFRGSGLANWVGLVIVVQNVVGSLFNSHLFDFVQGWIYVVGVGVAGGVALKQKMRAGKD